MREAGETPSMALEFVFGCFGQPCKGGVNALKMRCGSGEIYVIVEDNDAGNGGRVRFCMSDQKMECKDEAFLMRLDGICHRIDRQKNI